MMKTKVILQQETNKTQSFKESNLLLNPYRLQHDISWILLFIDQGVCAGHLKKCAKFVVHWHIFRSLRQFYYGVGSQHLIRKLCKSSRKQH